VERLSADDYFREALAVLGESGSEGMTIAVLCDRLTVTKGSFYHHFGGMPGFVTALLRFWESEHSDRLIALSKAQPDPRLRIFALTDIAVELPHASEAAFRAWGKSNAEVAAVQSRVDRRRENHLVEAFQALGIDHRRSLLMTRIALNLLVGVQQREHPVDLVRLREMYEELNKLVFLETEPGLLERLAGAAGH
jgi:AcrR family transcriptional regulator